MAVPIAKQAVALVFFFAFVADWTNYFLPLVMLPSTTAQTVSVGLQLLITSSQLFNPSAGGLNVQLYMPELALAAVLQMLPVLLVFIGAQRYLVCGKPCSGRGAALWPTRTAKWLSLVHLHVVENQCGRGPCSQGGGPPGPWPVREQRTARSTGRYRGGRPGGRLQRLYTGIIFDVMRALAIAPGVLPPNITALDPPELAGPVWTVHGNLVEGADAHDTLLDWTRMLSGAPAGCVVVSQPENHEIALMGELSSEAMKSRGVRGYVVDGGCRDTAFIRRLGFPVYCRFTTPRDIVGRWLTDQLGAR